MKKLGFTLLFAFSMFLAQAQILPVSFGLKGGLNLSTVSFSDKSTTAAGFHAGAFASFNPGKLGIRAEALFSNKGSKATFTADQSIFSAVGSATSLLTNNLTGDISLWYLDVPVLLDYKLISLLGVSVNFRTGPQFSFKLSDKISFSQVLQGNNPVQTDKFNFNTAEFGWVFDVGAKFLMIDAGVRYNLGISKSSNFSNIVSDPIGTVQSTISGTDLKNHFFQVYVGWSIL
ncbi:MAG: PorT family protein [Bacteroidetes bacterium]|nr:MAG: PorT family protein [Bacteroidota bacterium]